jgi:hypothetical protein
MLSPAILVDGLHPIYGLTKMATVCPFFSRATRHRSHWENDTLSIVFTAHPFEV